MPLAQLRELEQRSQRLEAAPPSRGHRATAPGDTAPAVPSSERDAGTRLLGDVRGVAEHGGGVIQQRRTPVGDAATRTRPRYASVVAHAKASSSIACRASSRCASRKRWARPVAREFRAAVSTTTRRWRDEPAHRRRGRRRAGGSSALQRRGGRRGARFATGAAALGDATRFAPPDARETAVRVRVADLSAPRGSATRAALAGGTLASAGRCAGAVLRRRRPPRARCPLADKTREAHAREERRVRRRKPTLEKARRAPGADDRCARRSRFLGDVGDVRTRAGRRASTFKDTTSTSCCRIRATGVAAGVRRASEGSSARGTAPSASPRARRAAGPSRRSSPRRARLERRRSRSPNAAAPRSDAAFLVARVRAERGILRAQGDAAHEGEGGGRAPTRQRGGARAVASKRGDVGPDRREARAARAPRVAKGGGVTRAACEWNEKKRTEDTLDAPSKQPFRRFPRR